ncbi:MAG TPA: GntR family transcriptional regulator [Tissierellia bacterium]|jgi:GntR family transcriptional regulator|nr:GntR family transcriptional regulator [Tissierellia bacterium]
MKKGGIMNFSEDRTIYEQISEIIERDILRGDLKEDDQAPSTNQFAKVYQINPATARKGMNLLVEEGVLYKKRGMGMFVAKGAKQIIIKKRQKVFFDEMLPQLLREAKRLDITKEEVLEYLGKENL